MEGHCSCCEEARAKAMSLAEANNTLVEKGEQLESENSRLERRIDDLNDEVNTAEELCFKAERDQDKIRNDYRDERREELALLRRLEFSLHGLCPLCLGIVEHKTGCDLKLRIFHLDHAIHRSQYVHL